MLREIGPVRQDSERMRRRWFQNEDLDLFVWQNAEGRPTAMQLCYDRSRHEHAVTWDERTGFAQHAVDAGDLTPMKDMTPLLRTGGTVPFFDIYTRSLAAAPALEPALRDFVRGRLDAYRTELFGQPRRPRRRRHPRRALPGGASASD